MLLNSLLKDMLKYTFSKMKPETMKFSLLYQIQGLEFQNNINRDSLNAIPLIKIITKEARDMVYFNSILFLSNMIVILKEWV